MKNQKSKIKNLKLKMIFFLIIGFAVFTSYSYSNFGQWEVFTNKNDVRDIALSNDGNTLWAATTGGVVAWDLGDNSYKSYTTLDGLISCNISQVAIDKKGRPWVATKNPAGLFIYENHLWKEVKVGGSDIDLKDKYRFISGLEVDQFGYIWVNTSSTYLSHYSDTLWHYDGQTWHTHEGMCRPLALDPQKNLLAVDSLSYTDIPNKGYYQFKIVSFNGSEFINKYRSKINENWPYIELAHIALDSKGNPWISYYDDRFGETYGVVCNDILLFARVDSRENF